MRKTRNTVANDDAGKASTPTTIKTIETPFNDISRERTKAKASVKAELETNDRVNAETQGVDIEEVLNKTTMTID